ncbi:hypothetical protein PIB30_094535, partial [Stylosanthes scabra]|nr:hypothetical protein [Stylosanthes scabra]
MTSLLRKKGKGKEKAQSSEAPRFKSPFYEAHFKGKFSARKVLPEVPIDLNDDILSPYAIQIRMRKWEKFTAPLQAVGHNLRKANKDYRLEEVQECLCLDGRQWVLHKDGRPHYLRRNDLEPMAKGWYDFICRSILPTTNRFELTVERAVLIHSIIIGENIIVEEIIAEQFYKFIYKTDLSSSLPFPSIIAALCLDAKVTTLKDDTLINQELPIAGEALIRTREGRARNPRQETLPPQQPPQVRPQPPVHQQQEIPPNFYTHFDASMSQIYRRLDQQQEESRKSFEAINTRIDRMDDQLSFLCYSNQMANETMHREEEMNRERMRHNQTVQEAASQRAREVNKGKAREVEPDSKEEESEEMYSSPSEE